MGVSEKAKKAYEKFQKAKGQYDKAKGYYDKAKGYYETAKNILDEDTRSEELFKQGLKGLLKLGEKVVGGSLEKHPYFAYHKVHLEVLGKALTASDTHHNAMAALAKAIESADASELLSKQVAAFKQRMDGSKFQYGVYLGGGLQTLKEVKSNPKQAEAILKEAGHTEASLRAKMDGDIYIWRAEACDLFNDSIDLMTMVDIEYRAADKAYAKFKAKLEKLNKSGGNLDKIAAKSAEYKQQLEWASRELDRAYNRGGDNKAPEAVIDPSLHAKRQRDKVDEMAKKLATLCDAALSDKAYDPDFINREVGSL